MSAKDSELKPFVVRPRPYPMESFTGFLIRVADANRFQNAARVLESRGLTPRQSNDLRQLEVRLKLAHGVLERQWREPPPANLAETDFKVGELTVSRADIRRRVTQICPECVLEFGYCHIAWELRYVVACPHHQCLLLTHCPNCERWLSDQRGRILQCGKCQFDLEPKDASRNADSRAIALSRWIVGAVIGEYSASPGLPTVLQQLGVREGLRAMRTLAWMELGPKAAWLNRVQGGSIQRHHELCRVLDLLEDWPRGWWRALDDRVSQAELTPDFGLRSLFRREIDQLDVAGTAPECLREAFSMWLEARYPAIQQSSAFKAISNGKEPDPEWVSVTDAAADLGVSYRTVCDLAAAGELERQYQTLGRDRRQLISTGSLEAYTAHRADQLTIKAAANVLGVNRKTVTSFVETGLLEETDANSKKARLVSKSNVDRLIQSIESALKSGSRRPKVGVTGALVMGSRHWTGLADIVELIRDGGLSPVQFNPKDGLRSLVFEKE